MTKIGLLSDTHNFLNPKVFEYFKNCDEIWHAGDIGTYGIIEKLNAFKPLRAVYCNIDGFDIRKSCPEHQRFLCEKLDVWITHIGGYPGRYDTRIRELIKKKTPKLFICGHSHILKVIYDKKLNLLHINPGAAGTYGIQTVSTLVRFTIEGSEIKDLEVIELRRGNT